MKDPYLYALIDGKYVPVAMANVRPGPVWSKLVKKPKKKPRKRKKKG